jgi:hypothetical protein
MSRHNRKVPTSFFYRFTRDICAFANKWAHGRIVSVLEGGYSDKALLSGAMAHLVGLVDGRAAEGDNDHSREAWWSPENVQMVRCLRKIGVNSDADSWSVAGEAGHQETSGPTTFARRYHRHETAAMARSYVCSARPARSAAQRAIILEPQRLCSV